jgi:hypothetical protein
MPRANQHNELILDTNFWSLRGNEFAFRMTKANGAGRPAESAGDATKNDGKKKFVG